MHFGSIRGFWVQKLDLKLFWQRTDLQRFYIEMHIGMFIASAEKRLRQLSFLHLLFANSRQ